MRRCRRFLAVPGLLAAMAAAPAAVRAADDPAADAVKAAKAGDRAQALRLSEEAVKARPTSASAWAVRGYALSSAGRKDEALEAYAKAASLDPRDVFARVNRGAVLLELARPAEALPVLDEALAIDPRNARAMNHRGVALERLGRLEEARVAYRAAIALAPRDPVPYNNLGALAFRRGVDAAASAHFAKALEVDPAFQPAAVNVALTAVATSSPSAGAAAEDAVLAAAARPDASYKVQAKAKGVLGARAVRAGDWATAKARFLEQVSMDPEDAGALNDLAVTEDQLGEAREALNHLEAALAARRRRDAAQQHGPVHVHRGDYGAAEAAFRQVLKEEPTFHRACTTSASSSARATARALRRVPPRVDLAPSDASTLYNSRCSRARPAATAAERAAYERALLIDPKLVEAHLALGTLLADPTTPGLRDPAKAACTSRSSSVVRRRRRRAQAGHGLAGSPTPRAERAAGLRRRGARVRSRQVPASGACGPSPAPRSSASSRARRRGGGGASSGRNTHRTIPTSDRRDSGIRIGGASARGASSRTSPARRFSTRTRARPS
jgi:Flp pilus assembly protein TadD